MSTIISKFDGMIIDMEYDLCIPCVHARYREENIIVDFSGAIQFFSENFPSEKIHNLVKWVKIHSDEIVANHIRKGHNETPNSIKPYLRL